MRFRSHAIGVAKPVSIMVDTFGTGIIPDHEIAERLMKWFDFRPAAIIKFFDLRRLFTGKPPRSVISAKTQRTCLGRTPQGRKNYDENRAPPRTPLLFLKERQQKNTQSHINELTE